MYDNHGSYENFHYETIFKNFSPEYTENYLNNELANTMAAEHNPNLNEENTSQMSNFKAKKTNTLNPHDGSSSATRKKSKAKLITESQFKDDSPTKVDSDNNNATNKKDNNLVPIKEETAKDESYLKVDVKANQLPKEENTMKRNESDMNKKSTDEKELGQNNNKDLEITKEETPKETEEERKAREIEEAKIL